MKRIGLTGGIGSGKSTIANELISRGYPVFFSDTVAREIQNTNSEVEKEIKKVFGEESYDDYLHTLNREYIANIVFNDKSKLEAMGAIVHPWVLARYLGFVDTCSKQGHKYSFYESALLFDSETAKDIDAVVVVTAPSDIRITRVMERNGISEGQVRARMKNQPDELLQIEHSDLVLLNDGSIGIVDLVDSLLHDLEFIFE